MARRKPQPSFPKPKCPFLYPPGADSKPLTPDPTLPRCPHHAVGKSKAIGVGDDLHEYVRGVQYVCQHAVFAVFTNNLQERTECVLGKGWEALLGSPPRWSRTFAQPLAVARGSIRPPGTSFMQNQRLGF